MTKHIPTLGEHLFIHQRTGNCWVDEVHRPYTVIEIKNENTILIQEAKAIFPEIRYYDTLPTDIVEDKEGKIKTFKWNEKRQRWIESPVDTYPYYAVFGEWDWQPYLN